MAQILQGTKFTNMAGAKILVLAYGLPKPDVAAGDVRFFAMLQLLAKNNVIDFYTTGESASWPLVSRYKANIQEISINVLKDGDLKLELALLRNVYDIVLFEFWHCAEQFMPIIRRQQPQAKVVIDSVDIHFQREEAGLTLGISEASTVRQNKLRETETYQQADLVVVVTQEDREALEAVKITKPLTLVPMIVPIRAREIKQRAPELLFVGGFRHLPNVDGLLWFISKCWPTIHSNIPSAKLTVVGSNAPEEIQDLEKVEGVEVAGFVPDTEPYLDRASLSIAPLRFGAGMKGKVTEAMAAGIPVVTTSFGVQGLGAVSGKHLMVADTPDLFSQHVITLLSTTSQSEAIGLAGQNHISNLCSAGVVETQLNEIVHSLMLSRVSGQAPFSILVAASFWIELAAKFSLLYLKKGIKKPFKLIKSAYKQKRISTQIT